MVDKLIQEEKLNRCHGCAIQHPSQRQRSCLILDKEDSWLYYREDVVEKIDLNAVLNNVESVCKALGFKLGQSWKMYVSELPMMPWTSIFLASLEVDGFDSDIKSRVERFNLTFKNKMYKYFTAKNTLTCINVLPQLVSSYNNTYHRSIKMKPSEVTKANETKVWDTLYGNDVEKRVRFKFQVGDRVRISKVKRMLPNFTEEMFTVYKRMARQVPVYKLKDDAGEILDGTFYEPELQKITKNDDVYRVEKILRKRKRKGIVEYFVKWKGCPDKFNSWIAESNISKF